MFILDWTIIIIGKPLQSFWEITGCFNLQREDAFAIHIKSVEPNTSGSSLKDIKI